MLFVPGIDQADGQLEHGVHLIHPAFGNHQRQRNEGVVGYAFPAILTIKNAVVLHKPKEQRGSNTLVPVAEAVVLRHQIKQHSSFFLNRRIEFLAVPGLVDLADGTMERLVLFISEQGAFAKFSFQLLDDGHCIFVRGVEPFWTSSLLDLQCLVIVAIQRVQCIRVILNDIED